YGQSKGAQSAALGRARRMSKYSNMVDLASRLYNKSKNVGYGIRFYDQWVVPGGQLCWQCGPVEQLDGSFATGCAAETLCGGGTSGPLGAPLAPGHTRVWGGRYVAPTGVARYNTNAHWIRPVGQA